MKKLKLLLLALAVVALLVTGLAVTVSADNDEIVVSGTAPTSIPDNATVVVTKATTNVPYNPTATYTVAEDSGIGYSFTDLLNNKISFKAFGDNGVNLKKDFYGPSSIKTVGFAIKLYADCIVNRGRSVVDQNSEDKYWAAYANGTETFSTYLDLNGYTLAFIDDKAGSTTFTLYGKSYRDVYIYSSRPNGVLANYANVSGTISSGAVFGGYNTYCNFYFGTVEFGGKTYDGDNLSVYAGGLVGAASTGGSVNVDGGYYCNPIAKNTGGFVQHAFESITVKNASLYTAGGQFFNFTSTPKVLIENCELYTDFDNGSGYVSTLQLAQTSTGDVRIKDCMFITPETHKGINSIVVGGSSYTQSTANVVFEDCLVSQGPNITGAKHSPDHIVKLSANVEKSYNFPMANFTADGLSFTDRELDVVYNRFATDVVLHHNITLGADLVYNVYLPNFGTTVTVDGENAAVTVDGIYKVVSIPVPAKNAVDKITVTVVGLQKTYEISVLDYIDQALAAYADDAALVSTLEAVKDYAKAAAEYFNYNADAYTYEYYNDITAKAEGDGIAMAAPSADFLAVITGAKIRLNGEIAFVFGVAENASGNVVFNYNYNGKAKTETVNVAGQKEIVISVKAIDLHKGVAITVGSETINYNLQNYIYSTAKNPAYNTNAALMTLLTCIENYSLEAISYILCTDGHTPADAVVENYVDIKDATYCSSYDSVVYCADCGIFISSESVMTKHTVDSAKEKYVSPTPEAEGSYDIVEKCTDCAHEISRQSVVIPAFSDNFTYELQASGAYKGTYFISGITEKGASLTKVEIPYGVAGVMKSAFNSNKTITEVIVPETVVYTQSLAFALMSNLTKLVFHGAPVIGSQLCRYANANLVIYYGGASNATIESQATEAVNRMNNVYYYSETEPTVDGKFWHYEDGEVTAWPSLTEIGLRVNFTYTKDADNKITITGLTEAGKAAQELIIPNEVYAIAQGALAGMTAESLSIPFVGANSAHSGSLIFGYIFGASEYGTQKDFIPSTLKYLTITGGTKIGANAFRALNDTTKIKIESVVVNAPTLTTFEGGAFYQAKSIQVIDLRGSGLTTIKGSYAIYNGHAQLKLYLPDTITSYANDTHRSSTLSIYWNGSLESWQALGKTEAQLRQDGSNASQIEVFYLGANGEWVEYEDGSR